MDTKYRIEEFNTVYDALNIVRNKIKNTQLKSQNDLYLKYEITWLNW